MASNSFFFISGMEKPQLREKGDWPITTQSLGESSIRSCPPHSVASVVDRGEIASDGNHPGPRDSAIQV